MSQKTKIIFSRKSIDSVASMVDTLVEKASSLNASDIHIDPKVGSGEVLMRIDGMLTSYAVIEKELMSEIVGRIKVLSGLRGDVHDKSQDGRFFLNTSMGRVDVRVSIAPTYYGENTVMRLLFENNQYVGSLVELGFSKEQEDTVLNCISKPQGMIIVCGPTGSGKTSTLYSLLQNICSGERCVVSLEDPVEYPLPQVRQIQLKSGAGYGFQHALRGILRQDPDVIMVGEMRDKETASVSVQIALTGHLVMTSLHAEDAVHVIPRLIDMGIDSYLLAATVRLIIGQRLVRKVHEGEYKGRVGIFEVLEVNDTVRKAIVQQSSAEVLKEIAVKSGYQTMKEDGERKVLLGITTFEELKRVLHS